MLSIPKFSLPTLTTRKKAQMLEYATQVLEAHHQMIGRKGKNILHYTLQKKRNHISMNHYPKGDRIDYQTGAQYFYHCHRENFDNMEHGHFHCFLRYKHIPQTKKPVILPDLDACTTSLMTHIIAIAMNCYGQPIRLFTVNRWVSSEVWYNARHVPDFIKKYKMTLTDDPYWQVLDQWIEGMIHLFAPQIIWLQNERDRVIKQQQIAHPDIDAYDNHDLEELSEISIDLNKQIQWLLSARDVSRYDIKSIKNRAELPKNPY